MKFVPKAELEVEAVKFNGGEEEANHIIAWIKAMGGAAEWHAAEPSSHIRCGLKEHLRILLGSAYMFVYVGDYVMRDEEGKFRSLTQSLATHKYNRVYDHLTVVTSKPESEIPQALAA